MSIREMNEVIIRLYTDKFFRASFFCNPEVILNEFRGLKENEKNALKNLDMQQIHLFSRSLRAKSMNLVSNNFKLLFEYFKGDMYFLYDKYCSISPLGMDEPVLSYSSRFGKFMLQYYSGVESKKLEYNLVKYYLQKINARLMAMPKISIEGASQADENRPIVPSNVFFETYDYNMMDCLRNFSSEKVPVVSKHSYIMTVISGDIKVSEISVPLSRFLNYCNGAYSLKDIMNKLSNDIPLSALENELSPLIPGLVLRNQIYFKEVV